MQSSAGIVVLLPQGSDTGKAIVVINGPEVLDGQVGAGQLACHPYDWRTQTHEVREGFLDYHKFASKVLAPIAESTGMDSILEYEFRLFTRAWTGCLRSPLKNLALHGLANSQIKSGYFLVSNLIAFDLQVLIIVVQV